MNITCQHSSVWGGYSSSHTPSFVIFQAFLSAETFCLFAGSSFQMIDPMGISNWSVTFVDWSERRWHPKTYGANEVSLGFLKKVTVMFWNRNLLEKLSQSKHLIVFFSFSLVQSEDMSTHVTSVGEVCSLSLSLLWPLFLYLSFFILLYLWLLKHGDELHWPCTWNGITRPCYLFARKFHPDALETLVNLFPNYTSAVVWEEDSWAETRNSWT